MVKDYKNLAQDVLIKYGDAIANSKKGYNAAIAISELTKQFGDIQAKGVYLEYLTDYCDDPELKKSLEITAHFLSAIDPDVLREVKYYLYDLETLS